MKLNILVCLIFCLTSKKKLSAKKLKYIDAEILMKPKHPIAETVDFFIDTKILNCILAAMNKFKEIQDSGPAVPMNIFRMMLNMPENNRTTFLGFYGIQLPEIDPMFPPRKNQPIVEVGYFDYKNWQLLLPTLLQVLLRSNITEETLWTHISPQRGFLMQNMLEKLFPLSVLNSLGPISKKKNVIPKFKKPGFLGALPLGKIGGALGVDIPDLPDEESSSSAEEDEDGNPIPKIKGQKKGVRVLKRGNPLCLIMRTIKMSSEELSAKNVTLRKNETDLLMSIIKNDFFMDFNYERDSDKKFEEKVLEIAKSEIRETPYTPVEPKVGCKIRQLMLEQFKKVMRNDERTRVMKRVPLKIKMLMKAMEGVSQSQAIQISKILNEPKNKKENEFRKKKLPKIIKLLLESQKKGMQEKENKNEIFGKLAIKVTNLIAENTKIDDTYQLKEHMPMIIKKLMDKEKGNSQNEKIRGLSALKIQNILLENKNETKNDKKMTAKLPFILKILTENKQKLKRIDQKIEVKTKIKTLHFNSFVKNKKIVNDRNISIKSSRNHFRDVQMLI